MPGRTVRILDGNTFVVCDERVNTEETMRAGKINLAFGFAADVPCEHD